ncbi:MAG: hypothetical protein HQL76_03380 [Magnetococcales bacterium]|nr:hypothetical protein [Magnetococcales bacterium]
MNMGAGGYLPDPTPIGLHHHNLRPTMAWLVAIPAMFFGYSVTTYTTAVFASALLSGLSLFLLGRALFNSHAALILVALWSCGYAYLEVDTILLPDNIGASLIFLGIAALVYAGGGFRNDAKPMPSWNHRRLAAAFMAGLALWLGVGARETFVFHAVAAMAIIPMLGHRRRVFAWMTTAGLLGIIVEMNYFTRLFGDPLIRYKYFLGIDKVLENAFPHLPGGDLSWFLLRYPKLLHYTGSAEFALFATGIVGGLFWMTRLKERRPRINLLLLAFPFGMMAFLYLSVDPIHPFIEALVRYYAGCAAFFYLAAIDLSFRIIDASARFGPWARRLTLGTAAAALAGLCLWNLSAARTVPYLMIDGYDAYARVSDAANADVQRTGGEKFIYKGGGWGAIRPMYLSHEQGWRTGPAGTVFDRPGYFIAEWRRLNQNGDIHEFMPLLDRYPIRYRHRQGLDFTDLFLVGPRTIQRQGTTFTLGDGAVWTLGQDEGFTQTDQGRMHLDAPLTIPEGTSAWTDAGDGNHPPEERLLRLSFKASTTVHLGEIRARLLGWTRENPDMAISIYMGRAYHERSAGEERENILMAHLPRPLSRFRVILHTRNGPFTVRDVQLTFLTPHPLDRIEE